MTAKSETPPVSDIGYASSVDKAEAWDAISAKNAEITRLRAELAEANARAVVAFAAGIWAAANAAQTYEAECAKLQSRDGVIVYSFDSLTNVSEAILTLTPPDITAAAARVLLADDLAISAMAGAVHDGPLMADDNWFSITTPQGRWCVDAVRAALRAIAEGEK